MWNATPCEPSSFRGRKTGAGAVYGEEFMGIENRCLSDWPFDRAADWVEWVNAAQTEAEIEALRRCVNRGTPYGTETWQTQIAAMLGSKSTLHPRSRPRKQLELTNTQT